VPAIARTRAAADPIRDDRAPMILPPDAATIVAPRDVVEVVLEIYAERDVLRDSYETDDGISPEWYVAKIVRESSRALRAPQTGSDSNAGGDYRSAACSTRRPTAPRDRAPGTSSGSARRTSSSRARSMPAPRIRLPGTHRERPRHAPTPVAR
jgi:hypothetical protein